MPENESCSNCGHKGSCQDFVSSLLLTELPKIQRRSRRQNGEEVESQVPNIKSRSKSGGYVHGPIPLDWVQSALSIYPYCGDLLWAMWFLNWQVVDGKISENQPFYLSFEFVGKLGLTKNRKLEILNKLNGAGLIEMESKVGKESMITLKYEKIILSKEYPSDQGFILGHIPFNWIRKACQLKGRAATVSWGLWHLYAFNHGRPFALRNDLMDKFSISKAVKSKALKELQAAGLIKVEQKQSCHPIVKMLK